jgi:hypothetical protein
MIAAILASESQWIRAQFASIMTSIFYAEILIIIGSAGIGAILRNNKRPIKYISARNNVYNRFKSYIMGMRLC